MSFRIYKILIYYLFLKPGDPMECKWCKKPTDSETCSNCWEVVSRMERYVSIDFPTALLLMDYFYNLIIEKEAIVWARSKMEQAQEIS